MKTFRIVLIVVLGLAAIAEASAQETPSNDRDRHLNRVWRLYRVSFPNPVQTNFTCRLNVPYDVRGGSCVVKFSDTDNPILAPYSEPAVCTSKDVSTDVGRNMVVNEAIDLAVRFAEDGNNATKKALFHSLMSSPDAHDQEMFNIVYPQAPWPEQCDDWRVNASVFLSPMPYPVGCRLELDAEQKQQLRDSASLSYVRDCEPPFMAL